MKGRCGWEMFTRRRAVLFILTGLIAGSAFAPATNEAFLVPGMVKDPDNKAWFSRCYHPRGATQADANDIASGLYEVLDRMDIELDVGKCVNNAGNTTMLTLCNYGTKTRRVNRSTALSMHNNLLRDCGDRESRDENGNLLAIPLGGLRHQDDIQWQVWGTSLTGDPTPKSTGENVVRRRGFRNTFHENQLRRFCEPLEMPLDGEWHDECWRPNSHLLDNNGDCPLLKDAEAPTCMQYCELRRRYILGVEQPFANTALARCPRGAATCTWNDGLSVTLSKGWLAQLGAKSPALGKADTLLKQITGAISDVINFAYAEMETKAEGVTHTGGHTFAGREDWCGYWTFIPYITETSGTISVYRSYDNGNFEKPLKCVPYGAEPPITYRGQSAMKPIVGADGRPVGHAVLVWYDCETGRHAPDSEQNKEYLKPGVEKQNAGPGV